MTDPKPSRKCRTPEQMEAHRLEEARRRAAHPGEDRARCAAYRMAHLEECRVRKAVYNAAHREEIRERKAAKYAENAERERQRASAYYATHREARSAMTRCRRARKAKAPINDFTAAQWREMQEACDYRCAYCGKRAKGHLTQDHLTPLADGGSHTLVNILPACRSCNGRKYTGPVLAPVQPFMLLTLEPSKNMKEAA